MWLYKQLDRELGPVSAATLEELAACGVISNETLVRKADSADWIAYGEKSGGETSDGEEVDPVDAIVRFHCPGCGQKISAGKEDAGKQAECPSCATTVMIPASSTEAAEPPQLPTSPPANTSGEQAPQSPTSVSSTPPAIPKSPPSQNSTAYASAQPAAASTPPGSTQPPAQGKERNRHLKPILIGCGAALFVGCILMFGVFSAIIGAVNQTASENSHGQEESIPSEPSTTVELAPPFDYNTWNKQECRFWRSTGQRLEECTRCRGNGTIMTGRDSRFDPRNPSIQIACPQCRGDGRMPVRCTYCRGAIGN